MLRPTATTAVLFIWLPVLASADDVVTLDRAIREALVQNRALAAARENTREKAAQVDEARANFFPRFSLAESWQRGNQPVFVFSSLLSAREFGAANFALGALNRPDPTGFFHGAFAVEQVLFDGGRTRAAVHGAASAREMVDAGVGEMELDLIVRVTETYGRLLRAESARRAADAAAGAAREDLGRTERRRDTGVASDADVLSLQVHLADVQYRAIQASADAANARAELNQLIGAPVTRGTVVEEPVILEASSHHLDLAALIREAEAARPELRRADAAVSAAESGARLARAAWWPSVVAHAQYHWDGTRFGDRESAWVAGGELRWTWSAGGAQLASMRAASHATARARAERDDARAAVHVAVVSALRSLEAAEASEAVARSAVAQARESERIIRNRFDAGLVGVTDVLRASTASLEAQSRRVSALVNRAHALGALDRALGRSPLARGDSR